MVKEVSDKIVVILLIIAIVVSALGTILVYKNTINATQVVGTGKSVTVQNVEKITENGLPAGAKVGVKVIPGDENNG
jgi:hypothetical protein